LEKKIKKQDKCIIQEETYTPWKILCLKDKQGGKLWTASTFFVHSERTKKNVRDTIFCGSATIKRVAKIVESFGNTFIPYQINSLEPEHGKGEVSEFHLEKVLPVVLRATGL
jgi:hypothetical protein